jgi:hypothetical protein
MKGSVVLVLMFSFILIFSSFDNVSAIASNDEDEPGFFGSIGNWFSWLFFGEEDVDVIDEGDEDYEDYNDETDNSDDGSNYDDYDDYSGTNIDVQIIFNGPSVVGVNEPAVFTGSVTGAETCTLLGAPIADCSSFNQTLSFSMPGTYSIIFIAGGEVRTIVLVVEGVAGDSVGEDGGNISVESNESITIIFNGPAVVGIDEVATFTGSVTGVDSCLLNGEPVIDCSSFTKDFTYGFAGVQYITLFAGGNMEIRILTIEGDEEIPAPEDDPTDPIIPVGATDTVTDINEVPSDTTTLDATGWPAYLNVPEYCSPPATGEEYKHYWPLYSSGRGSPSVGPIRFGQVGPEQARMIKENNGNWYMTHMAGNEVYAVPVYTGNSDDWNLKVIGSYGQMMMETAFSKCPGDFDREDGNSDEGCSVSTSSGYIPWGASVGPRSRNYKAQCNDLEPATRYFLNVRWYADGRTYSCGGDAGSEKVCSAQSSYETSYKGFGSYTDNPKIGYPPYTGPYLSSPPFPANYDAGEVGNHPHRTTYSDGRCGTGTPPGSTITYTCTDGVGGEFITEYEKTCESSDWEWTKGGDVPATPNMVCTRDFQSAPKSNLGGCLGGGTIYPLGQERHTVRIEWTRWADTYKVLHWKFRCTDYEWDNLGLTADEFETGDTDFSGLSYAQYLPDEMPDREQVLCPCQSSKTTYV